MSRVMETDSVSKVCHCCWIPPGNVSVLTDPHPQFIKTQLVLRNWVEEFDFDGGNHGYVTRCSRSPSFLGGEMRQ